MPRIVVEAPAKLNLHLRVGGRRPDGYHDLESLFAALSFGDTLTFETLPTPQKPEILMNWRCQAPFSGEIPDKDNLITRAVTLFRERTGYETGLKITVEKRIPPGSGLGGGSSDAAAALLAMNRLAAPGGLLGEAALAEMGAALGSDVPFFLWNGEREEAHKDTKEEKITKEEIKKGGRATYGDGGGMGANIGDSHLLVLPNLQMKEKGFEMARITCAAWVTGRGERVRPLELPEGVRDLLVALVYPGFSSDTAAAYRLLDQWRRNNPPPPSDQTDHKWAQQALSFPPERWPFSNDFLAVFQAVGNAAYERVIADLRERGARFAGLSGSGAGCFGVFSPEESTTNHTNHHEQRRDMC